MNTKHKDKIFFYDTCKNRKFVEILESSQNLLILDYISPNNIKNQDVSLVPSYLAYYTLIENQLILSELHISHKYNLSLIYNNCVNLIKIDSSDCKLNKSNLLSLKYNSNLILNSYKNINLPIKFNGKLTVGYKKNHKSILNSNNNLNYWSNKYKYLIEITFLDGYISNFKILNKNMIKHMLKEKKK